MTDGLPPYTERVRPAWLDYNGHLSEAYYVLVFGHATDAMMAETGLHEACRVATGCSLYTVESHVRYLREVRDGAELRVRTRVLGVDTKRLRFTHEMYADGREPVATTELLGLHVDNTGAVPFPAQVSARYAALAEPAPSWAGRAIAPVPRG